MPQKSMTVVMGEFQQYLESLDRSPETIRNRMLYIERFRQVTCSLCYADDVYVSTTNEKHVTSYFQELSRTCGAAAKNNALVALRMFFRFCRRRGYVNQYHDPLQDRGYFKYTPNPKYYLPAERFPELLNAGEDYHLEDRAILACLLYTFGRQSDVKAIQFNRVHLGEEMIELYQPKTQRWMPRNMAPQLRVELDRWLTWYADSVGHRGSLQQFTAEHPSYYLVPGRQWDRSEYRARAGDWRFHPDMYYLQPERYHRNMENVVKRALSRMDIQLPGGRHSPMAGIGGHTIRRSGARAMFDHLCDVIGENKALVQVSEMLGHNTLKQTLTYIGRDIENDRLNRWLKTNDPFGLEWGEQDDADVIPLRGA